MRLVRDVMSHKILYVTREATVRTAVELMRTHQTEVVPVVEAGEVVGLLDALTLTLYDGETSVLEAASEPIVTVSADTPVAEAARLMRTNKLRQVPVLHDGRLSGLLSARDLLRVWGAVNDNLTGLPVQHQMRDWISRQLSVGQEVVVLFLDLNEFGSLNKQHGHVMGDRVLQRVADVLRESVDTETEFCCRFGGDEFAIASTLAVSAAHELAAQVRDRIGRITIEGLPQPIGVAIGMAGGRRTTPRPEAHTDAMLDDLITRASTASTAAKDLEEHIHSFESGPDEPGLPLPRLTAGEQDVLLPRVVVEGYQIGQSGKALEVTVALRAGEERHECSLTAPHAEINRAVATATARCLELFAQDRVRIEIEDTYEYSTPHGLSCVGATVKLTRDSASEDLVGSSAVRGDLYRSYINVILDATNRRISRG
jgi:IMP dehydrogenase